MSTQTQNGTVTAQIVVDVPVEHAFATFTRNADWKPRDHNIMGAEIAEALFEAHEGGYIYDRAVDGSECRWARVIAVEPPHRVVFAWLISPRWTVETDPSKASRVEVRFISEGPERTRIELEHSQLERHGEGWSALREGVGAPGGWPLYLQRLAELATS